MPTKRMPPNPTRAALETCVASLEGEMGAEGFWEDSDRAAGVSAEHARASRRLEMFGALTADVEDLDGLAEMAAEDASLEREVAEHAAQVGRLHLELAHAFGIFACEARGEDDPRHPQADKAASSRGGDIGSSVIRLPVAISIALAMAAIGGQMFTSPTPFAPYGCVGFGTSTSTASIIGRSEATGQR